MNASKQPLIKGVKVIGLTSTNGRRYTVEALRRAVPLYENVVVNVDHNCAEAGRRYGDRIGRLKNARFNGDGIYADLVYNPAHPEADGLRWWAENDSRAVGLSHQAQVRSNWTQEGIEEVYAISEVVSVDLVANPATTKGLMESIQPKRAGRLTVTKLVAALKGKTQQPRNGLTVAKLVRILKG